MFHLHRSSRPLGGLAVLASAVALSAVHPGAALAREGHGTVAFEGGRHGVHVSAHVLRRLLRPDPRSGRFRAARVKPRSHAPVHTPPHGDVKPSDGATTQPTPAGGGAAPGGASSDHAGRTPTSPASSSRPPVVADGRLLWTATARSPLADDWASYTEAGGAGTLLERSTQLSRIAEVTHDGKPAYRITVRAADRDRYTPDAQRSELGQGNPGRMLDGSDRKMRQGEERWIAEQIWIPASTHGGTSGWDFFNMNQMKADGQGGPPMSLGLRDGRIVLLHAISQAYGSVGGTELYTSPVVARDTWLEVVWHVKWSASGDGFVELYGDLADGEGLRQLTRYDGWTLKRDADGRPAEVHPRIGIYRRALDEDTTLYFSGYSVATTRDAAEAAAGFGAQAGAHTARSSRMRTRSRAHRGRRSAHRHHAAAHRRSRARKHRAARGR